MFIFWIIGWATNDVWGAREQHHSKVNLTNYGLEHNYTSDTISILNFRTELLCGLNNHFACLISETSSYMDVSGYPNKTQMKLPSVKRIGKSCTSVDQRCGRNWSIFWMDQFEGSMLAAAGMNMCWWICGGRPALTSHLSKLSRTHLSLVNFALFFLFLTKHYTVILPFFPSFFLWKNIPENSIYMFSLININHIMWYCDWIHC